MTTGALEWFSWLSDSLLISAQVMISGLWGQPRDGHHIGHGVCLRFFLSLPFPLHNICPPSHAHAHLCAYTLKKRKKSHDIWILALSLQKDCLKYKYCLGGESYWPISIDNHWSFWHRSIFFRDFIYLFIWDIETTSSGKRKREKQTSGLLCKKPNMGLDPRTPWDHTWPELKADTQPTELPRRSGIDQFSE